MADAQTCTSSTIIHLLAAYYEGQSLSATKIFSFFINTFILVIGTNLRSLFSCVQLWTNPSRRRIICIVTNNGIWFAALPHIYSQSLISIIFGFNIYKYSFLSSMEFHHFNFIYENVLIWFLSIEFKGTYSRILLADKRQNRGFVWRPNLTLIYW